jgi:acyl-CoA thioesterase FadM
VIFEFPLHLPRNAFSARDAARGGDIWRAFQDVALLGSTACGWPPSRYRADGIAFVVRAMTARHFREAHYGEQVTARTCISEFRRGLLITRQIELMGDGSPIAQATQEWAHVRLMGDGMRPARASEALQEAFQIDDRLSAATFPEFREANHARTHDFHFPCWHTWMDPLAHANHPAYVDWCDEAISVAMAKAGLDPLALQPVAERVKWRSGVEAPAEVQVRTRVMGLTAEGDVVCEHRIAAGEDPSAIALTVRRMVDGRSEALLHALR